MNSAIRSRTESDQHFDDPSDSPESDPSIAGSLALPVVDLLRELASVVSQLSAQQYVAHASDAFFKGTIGGHVRHCLDHIRALADRSPSDAVEYDRRIRNTDIENDPLAARDEIRRLRRLVNDLAILPMSTPLAVRVLPTRDGDPVDLHSTLGRELAFVLSHTIHHNATIKGIAVGLGVALPGTFGYAPATLAHRASTSMEGSRSCAH